MDSEQPLAVVLDRIRKKWDVEFEPLTIDGTNYHILSINNMRAHLDRLAAGSTIQQPLRDLPLWAKLWPGSLVLGRFLRKFEPQGKTLLELGCGLGALSLAATAHGFAKITATDINQDALDFAAAHMLKNNVASLVETRWLDVAKPPSWLAPQDMIAASELLYLDDLHRPLLKFLDRFLKPGGKAFFCTDMARLKPGFQKLAARHLRHFSLREGKIGVKCQDADTGEQRRIFSILIMEKP